MSGGGGGAAGGTGIAAEKIRDDFAESTRIEPLVDVGNGSMHILLARRHTASHIPAEPPPKQCSVNLLASLACGPRISISLGLPPLCPGAAAVHHSNQCQDRPVAVW